ncbi:MAG: hypothetical protein KF678_14010 [Phycisphaeraceae bacterium]|nr:hypothetical protein [Phycisphaeraceae bacterium]
MQPFKATYFERDHPGERYPAVDPLPSAEVASLAGRLAPLITRVHASEPLPGVDANPETFRLSEVWATAGIHPADELLLSFDAMQSIDAMRREDVERNFSDVWYPVSDNLFIFDGSASWLMFVHHDGFIYVVRD